MRPKSEDVDIPILQAPLSNHLPLQHGNAAALQSIPPRRVSIDLPIEISGTDLYGLGFVERGGTRVISAYGASIVLPQMLGPEQEIMIRIVSKRREFAARVVGQIGVEPKGNIYGIACVEPRPNAWGIAFPPMADSRAGLTALMLRCGACSARSMTELNDIELDVLRRSEMLSRHCKHCNDMTIWKRASDVVASCAPEAEDNTEALVPAEPPKRQKNPDQKRKKSRVKVRMSACVMSPSSNEDIVAVVDLSTDGLRFVSRQKYSAGIWLRVAVPYTAGSTNIFTEARVVWAAMGNEISNEYGLKYIKHR